MATWTLAENYPIDLMSSLTLYMTEHCGLCEKVLEMLFNTPAMQGLGLKTVDIALDEALMELYGSKIPVLLMNGEELSAPISAPQLENWLRTHCK